MYQHYLITRFNLKNPDWTLTKNNESLLTDDWMIHRLELFSHFCLPSVLAQSQQNFKWLIYFDTSTSKKFRSQINDLLDKHKHIHTFFIDGMPEFKPSIMRFIKQDEPAYSYIISSRIDNDDCMHKDYIKTVQAQFNQQEFLAIDCVKGYSLQLSPKMMLGKKEHVFNPFISLIESKKNFKTVWQSDHNMWKTENRITKITHKRLWMSIIHEKNKVNQFDGYDHVSWKTTRENFKISSEIEKEIDQHLIPYNQWKFLSFKNKIYINYVLLSKNLKKQLGIYKLKNK